MIGEIISISIDCADTEHERCTDRYCECECHEVKSDDDMVWEPEWGYDEE